MWREYSANYIRGNRASGITVMASAFISALLLSLLCSLFYNFWAYDIQRIKAEEGDWQARLSGVASEEELAVIRNFANVERVIVQEGKAELTVDIYFSNLYAILEDMPRIAEALGIDAENITYHHALLSMYLIRDPADPAPRLVFPLFLAILALACFSLIMIIHNAFAVSMDARVHQFGIFASIGATPAQIRACLLQEAAALCAVPLLAGQLFGIIGGMGVLHLINAMAADVQGRFDAVWTYHPLVFAVTLAASIATVWISAWIPAHRLSRMTVLEAVRNTGERAVKKKKRFWILPHFFGMEGELAANALYAQRKSLRTAKLSLTVSFLAFSLMLCFFTLTGISQRMTYFERYQKAWDIYVTLKNTDMESLTQISQIRELPGVRSCTAYQRASAKRLVTEAELSAEALASGNMQRVPESYVMSEDGAWLVNAPIIILDDESFLEYCAQLGTGSRLDGAIILNRMRDSSNPDFRSTDYFPYLQDTINTTALRPADVSGERQIAVGQEPAAEGSAAELLVLAYTQEPPVLREAYGETDYYELVHFLPLSLWESIRGQVGGENSECCIRILAKEGAAPADLQELEQNVMQILGSSYEMEIENRIQEKLSNDEMQRGMMWILGGFCTLLALIGIADVFSNTMGFVRQRKREFARYLSVGLTPEGMKKMFCLEAAALVGRPALVSLLLTAFFTGLMIKASYLEPGVFLRGAPLLPLLLFFGAAFGMVALAYYLGGRRLMQISLAGALRDDTML